MTNQGRSDPRFPSTEDETPEKDIEKKHLESKRKSVKRVKDHEARPTAITMLSEPPPPPIKSDSLPTISVTLMRSRRMCELPWYDKEVMGSEDQYIFSDEVALSETISERRGRSYVEEGVLRGTFKIKRRSVEEMQYGIQPDLRESTLSHSLPMCSCESVKEEGLTSKSPHLKIVDAEGMKFRFVSNSATSPSTTRRQWFKGLRIRLRRFFLCCNGTEEN
nr:hypothetical protein HmN_000312800 [Hymenolepis microstoma]